MRRAGDVLRNPGIHAAGGVGPQRFAGVGIERIQLDAWLRMLVGVANRGGAQREQARANHKGSERERGGLEPRDQFDLRRQDGQSQTDDDRNGHSTRNGQAEGNPQTLRQGRENHNRGQRQQARKHRPNPRRRIVPQYRRRNEG